MFPYSNKYTVKVVLQIHLLSVIVKETTDPPILFKVLLTGTGTAQEKK